MLYAVPSLSDRRFSSSVMVLKSSLYHLGKMRSVGSGVRHSSTGRRGRDAETDLLREPDLQQDKKETTKTKTGFS